MEYVQRAVYGPDHKLSHLMHDKVHLSDGCYKTLCGKDLNEMWFVTGNDEKEQKEVTCRECKDAGEQITMKGRRAMTKPNKRAPTRSVGLPALLPCPFCGSESRLVDLNATHPEVPWDGRYFVECDNPCCPVRPSTGRHARPEAVIKRWNTRAG